MAAEKHLESVPQVGTHFGGESHSSSEDTPVDSGEGTLLPMFQEPVRVSMRMDEEEDGAFNRSSLTQRTPPDSSNAPRSIPTEADLDNVHRAMAEGDQPFDTSRQTEGGEIYSPGSMELDRSEDGLETETLDYNLYLPSKYRKKLLRERKEAEGTWLSNKQWRRSKGLRPHKRVAAKGSDSGGHGSGPVDGESASSKRPIPLEKRTEADKPSGVKRPRRWDQGPTQSGPAERDDSSRPTFKEQVISFKMAVVPEAFPEVKLNTDECNMLQEKLVDEVWNEVDTHVPPLQILTTYLEKGALIVTCGNEETKGWLKAKGPGLGTGCYGGAGLIVGEYKDLLRSTKALLRTDKFLAKRDPKLVLRQLEKQNAGLSTEEWRIIGVKKEEDHQTLVLSIDELSSQTLQSRGWRVYLGIARLQLRVLSGGQEDDKGPTG